MESNDDTLQQQIQLLQQKHDELVLRIAKLANDNKLLEKQAKKLTLVNENLQQEKEKYKKALNELTTKGIKPHLYQKRSESLKFNMATVLFIHVHGFKKMSDEEYCSGLFDELDQFFVQVDVIAKNHHIEKIKTIGDTYMYAGGVPVKNGTNPVDVALAAVEMKQFLNEHRAKYESQNKAFWDIRFGIHTGPVTATAVGKKKISYDIKGDTVNTAHRMQSSSEPGKINISVMTYELVKDYFTCDYHGKMPVKYKEGLEMYYMRRLKKALSHNREGAEPNELFWSRYKLRQFTDLQEIILDKLEKELPERLYYHNVKHTIDVVTQVELIGWGEGVTDEEILLLKTAALFHDAGHITGYDNHEYHGTIIVREYLPKFNYTPQEIDKICELIMNTQLPPNPQTLLEKIICDSDLDYLGRSDFIPVSNTLYEELQAYNKIGSLNDWNKLQLKFLSSHQFFTNTAQKLREVNKQLQIDRISALIE